jgi:hypothetical protein
MGIAVISSRMDCILKLVRTLGTAHILLNLTSIDTTSKNEALMGILYNGIMYDSVSKFRSAWSSPGFVKLPKPQAGDWCRTDRSGQSMPYDSEPGPVQVSRNQRYSVDYANQYVEWMDFSFYMGVTKGQGLSLYSISYQGERIIFELCERNPIY